jgi:tetratricopeptide (TPR) repeat protein
LLVLSSVWAAGCATAPKVRRVYSGQALDGRFVEPDAYAAYLRGVLAESAGDTAGAIQAYERAARLDPRGPEVWARIAATRCAASPHDTRAAEALRRALDADPRYAPAWEAEARCAVAMGDLALADRAAVHAWELRQGSPIDGPICGRSAADGGRRCDLFVGLLAGESRDEAARAAIVRSSAEASDPAVAAEVLARWAQAHDHVALWAHALEVELAANPSGRANLGALVAQLAGLGRTAEARAIAAAVVDVSDAPIGCSRCDVARRLAVDDAIDRGDDSAARRRASRARVALEEVAARFLLAGSGAKALAIAREVKDADPGALGAELVIDAIEGAGAGAGAGPDPRRHPTASGAPASAASWIAWGGALSRRMSAEAARSVLAAVPHESLVPGDERVERAAVDLAARGVLTQDALTPDARVELRALRWAASSAVSADDGASREPTGGAPNAPETDLRHAYLAMAVAQPGGQKTRELAERLLRIAPRERVVAAAAGVDLLGRGGAIDPAAPRALLALDPRDPLLAAVAYRLALKVSDVDVARRARAALPRGEGGGGPLTE